MKRCPKCHKEFPDDANFCPVDAGHLVAIDPSESAPSHVPRIDTGGHELLAGRFTIGDLIGGHRSGPVYQSGDKQGAAAIVKIVDPRVFPTALLKQRTERELKQLERLDHVGVTKILAHGRREDALWIAMELVDGVPLSQFIAEQGPLPQPRVLGILKQIGSALEAAAKLGVTHRDLSPKNVLIAQGDQIKMINFGIPLPAQASDTVQGVIEYVAPEQVEGRPVDQRCNIYSLGAIAYALLTGAPPFVGVPADVLAGHSSGEVNALSVADGVSVELNTVILKALEKTSSKRFMTLRQFIGELQKAEGTAPAAAAPVAAAPAAAAPFAAAPVAGKPPRAAPEMNKTLMGVVPAEIQALLAANAAAEAQGTPPPAGQGAEAGGTARDSLATTSLDHKAPDMAQHQAAAMPQAAGDQAATLSHPSVSDQAATLAHEAIQGQPVSTPAPAPQDVNPFSKEAATVAAKPSATAHAQAAFTAADQAQQAQQPQHVQHAHVVPQQAQQAPVPQQAPVAARVPAGGKRKGGKSKPAPVKKSSKKGKFRETMWFKKGELDEAAAAAAAKSKPDDRISSKADEMEMDERYTDDGSITEQDQERLSLRTGATMMMESMDQPQAGARAQVSEDYLVSEMTGGRNKIIIAIALVFVVAGVIAFVALS